MIDPLIVDRACLEHFGDDVTVQITGQDARTVRMLFDDIDEDVRLGGLPGPVASPTFWALPDTASGIDRGTVLVLEGTSYTVFSAISRRGRMTEIRVK